METRHDTSLLERAVGLVVDQAAIPTKRAEADATYQVARATGLRRVATGGAVAIGAVGIGIAAWLALNQPLEVPAQTAGDASARPDESITTASIQKPEADAQQETSPAKEPRDPATAATETNPEAAGSVWPPRSGTGDTLPEVTRIPVPRPAPRPDIITTNFTKFVNRTTYLAGRQFMIEAGHQYASETDPTWSYAWCYTRALVDGVTINIDLAQRPSPGALPTTRLATRQTLEKAGISDADAQTLAAKCPWLDGKAFGVSEESSPPKPLPSPPRETKVVERTP